MAKDITIEADIVPVLDEKQANALIKRISQLQTKIKSGVSSKASEELSALTESYVATMVKTGKASTATSGRIMLEKRAGITSNQFAKAAMREGADKAKLAIREGRVLPFAPISDKRISRMRPDMAAASTAYNEMLSSYVAFKKDPSKESRDELLKSVDNIEAILASLGKDRKKSSSTISKIGKDAGKIGKEVSNWKDVTKPSPTANAMGAGAYIKHGVKALLGAFGITSVLSGIKKLFNMGVQGIQEGYNDLVEQAVYGTNRNIAGSRKLSKMYGIKEESVAGAERYALDFRQRMMMGEVSDQEFIALARMGSLGNMIASGEAAKDPTKFHKALQDYIRANKGNEAEVRQNLRWLGLSPELMAYGAIEHDIDRENMLEDTYERLVAMNKASALATLIPSQILKTVEDEIKSASGRGIKGIFAGPESLELLYRSMSRGSGFTPSEMERVYGDLAHRTAAYRSFSSDDMARLGLGLFNPLIPSLVDLRGARTETENTIAASFKSSVDLMPSATKEGVKEGVIEGLSEALKNTTNRSNFDRTVVGLANISSSNGGAY